MKRILKACIPFTLLLSVLIPTQAIPATAADPAANEDWTRFPLIAHALGGIDGVDYTNSLEAFQTNYDKGQRLFEVDFSITKDGLLAARHDWMGYLAAKFEQNIPAEKLEEPLTLKEFKSYKILENYTPLSFADVARLSKKYPDVYFITDTKETDPELVKQQFTVIRDTANRIDTTILDRFIPEIYTPEMLDIVRDIIPFKHVIFSLYLTSMEPPEVVQFVKEHDVHVVAMPEERATKTFIQDLNDIGVVTYVHSLNKVKDVKKLMRMGVHGVYTDFLSYKDLGIDEAPLIAAGQSNTEKFAANYVQKDLSLTTDFTDTITGPTTPAPAPTTWEKIKLLLGQLFNS